MNYSFVIFAIVASVSVITRCRTQELFPPNSTEERYLFAAVAADSSMCATVGRKILEKNGSAVDCAIATLLCMNVVLPESLGLGGGFLMTIYDRSNRKVEVLDSRETAPSRATKDMFKGNYKAIQMGGLSVAIPSLIPGFIEAHKKYGRIAWPELFTGAMNLSRNGFYVGAHFAQGINYERENLNLFPRTRKLLTNPATNHLYKEGEIFKNQLLHDTLLKLAEDPTTWYEEIARDLADAIQSAGGIVTYEDIKGYKPLWREPTVANLTSDFKVYSVPLPGSGAILSLVLNILQNFDLKPTSYSTQKEKILTYHRIMEVFKYGFARRMELGDPLNGKEFDHIIKELTSKEYAEYIAEKVNDLKIHEDPRQYGVKMYMGEDHGTSHVSVIAQNGDAVSVTSSINTYFGSKIMSKKTGIILNSQMDDFSAPDITNFHGLPPSPSNFIAPGKRPFSSMCPSLIIDSNDDVKLVLGSSGGAQITTSVALVILKTLFFGINVKDAIDDPRIHHQLLPYHVAYESDFSEDILNGLASFGHSFEKIELHSSVVGIIRGNDGLFYGHSDRRKGGAADGF